MYVIRTKYGNLGCLYNNKPYIIGFNQINMARKVKRVLTNPPVIILERNNIIDVTDGVKEGLDGLGIDKLKIPQITVDTNAELSVSKAKEDDEKLDNRSVFEYMEQHEFMMYSFEKNIGIIMPYEESNENEHVMVFTSNVVDPSVNIDEFRKTLNID